MGKGEFTVTRTQRTSGKWWSSVFPLTPPPCYIAHSSCTTISYHRVSDSQEVLQNQSKMALTLWPWMQQDAIYLKAKARRKVMNVKEHETLTEPLRNKDHDRAKFNIQKRHGAPKLSCGYLILEKGTIWGCWGGQWKEQLKCKLPTRDYFKMLLVST